MLPTCSPLDCYTRTHWRWKTPTGWSHAEFRKRKEAMTSYTALILLPKMLCNTYTQIEITKQKNSKLVIIKFALSVTVLVAPFGRWSFNWPTLWMLKEWLLTLKVLDPNWNKLYQDQRVLWDPKHLMYCSETQKIYADCNTFGTFAPLLTE